MQKQKDLRRSDFSSLDIFLFSNGQQDSPPRKYNLHTDELKFWDNTLNHLAREHYGSKHRNIELYTVDGRRVSGARDLRGGAAYVAVEPPARFVQSGYDNYLIKASRSWEKRQKSSNDAISLSETDKNESSNMTDVTNINMYQDILVAPAPSTITEEQIEVKTNTDSKAKKNEPKPAPVKLMQKRKITSPQPNPSILRKKYVNPVSPMAKKGSIPSKETSKSDTVKKKVDSHVMNSHQSLISQNSHRESSSLKVVSPVAAKLKDESPMIAKLNNIEIESPDNIYYVTQVPREDNHDNPDPSTLDVVDTVAENELSEKQESADTDVLSKIYHNEEHHQSLFINPTRPLINNDGTEEKHKSQREYSETEHKVVINSGDNEKINILSDSYYEVHGIEGKTNVIRSTDTTPTLDKKLVVCGNQNSDSCAICINPGETVNLKLSVEIKNGPLSMDNCKSINLIFQCNSTGKSEKGTQGAIGTAVERECLRGECEQTGRAGPECCAPLQQDILGREAGNDFKTIVCNCNCCSTSEKILPLKAAPVYFDNNNYFILLSSEKLKGNILGCNCIFESSSKTKVEPVHVEKISVSEAKKEDSLQLTKERLSALKTSFKTSYCVENFKCTNSSTPIMKNEEKAAGMIERCMSNQAGKDGMVCAEAKSTTTTTNSSGSSEASTQTDWTRLLLEVRLHDDGHYTFHLPPLEILKIYNVV